MAIENCLACALNLKPYTTVLHACHVLCHICSISDARYTSDLELGDLLMERERSFCFDVLDSCWIDPYCCSKNPSFQNNWRRKLTSSSDGGKVFTWNDRADESEQKESIIEMVTENFGKVSAALRGLAVKGCKHLEVAARLPSSILSKAIAVFLYFFQVNLFKHVVFAKHLEKQEIWPSRFTISIHHLNKTPV